MNTNNAANKKKYAYRGPVLYFGRVVADNWESETRAVSEKQAISNLIYQFKKTNGYIPDVRVTLGKKPVMVDADAM